MHSLKIKILICLSMMAAPLVSAESADSNKQVLVEGTPQTTILEKPLAKPWRPKATSILLGVLILNQIGTNARCNELEKRINHVQENVSKLGALGGFLSGMTILHYCQIQVLAQAVMNQFRQGNS